MPCCALAASRPPSSGEDVDVFRAAASSICPGLLDGRAMLSSHTECSCCIFDERRGGVSLCAVNKLRSRADAQFTRGYAIASIF